MFHSLSALNGNCLRQALRDLTPTQVGALPKMTSSNDRAIAQSFTNQILKRYQCSVLADKKNNTLWLEPLGYYFDQDREGDVFGFKGWSGGFAVGGDHLFSNQICVGGGVGYTNSELRWDHRYGKGTINSLYVGIYSSYITTGGYLLAAVLGSRNFYGIERNIHFAELKRTATNDHKGWDVAARLIGALNFEIKENLYLQPSLMADVYNTFEEGYNESGAKSLNLQMERHYSGIVRTNVGIKGLKNIPFKRSCWTPSLYLGWVKEVPLTNGRYKGKIRACPDTFSVQSFHKTRDLLALGTSVGGVFKNGVTIALRYELNRRGSYVLHNGDLNLSWNF